MLLTTAIVGVSSFLLLPSVPVTPAARHTRLFATEQEEGNFFTRFFTELDNFVDDATARRLGNGSEVSALGAGGVLFFCFREPFNSRFYSISVRSSMGRGSRPFTARTTGTGSETLVSLQLTRIIRVRQTRVISCGRRTRPVASPPSQK